jgi:hypothetical protein
MTRPLAGSGASRAPQMIITEAEMAQAREQLRALPVPPPDVPQDAPQRESDVVSPDRTQTPPRATTGRGGRPGSAPEWLA